MKAMNFFVKKDACGGCRICEIACSFYKTNSCKPSASAIQIINNPIKGVPTPVFTPECDCKDGAEECIQFCPKKVIQFVPEHQYSEYMSSTEWNSCAVLPSNSSNK